MKFRNMQSLHPLALEEQNRMPQQALIVILALTIALLISGCSPRKFGATELAKLGKTSIISHGEYRLFYAPSPSEEMTGETEKIAEDLRSFLEDYPLDEMVRQKFYKALTSRNVALDLVPETDIEKMKDASLHDFLMWARENRVDAVIHLESILEVSHIYRVHAMPLRYYPKVWIKAQIIRLKDDAILWSKRVWTHAMDGTAAGLPSRSPYDYVFESSHLESLIDKKIDFVVNTLVKDLI